MGHGQTQSAWTTLDTLLTTGTLGSCSDGQLLEHFRRSRDTCGQEAFRILVERHGAMVLAVCRGLVKDSHEAEDAFQATFLVLVRRSESIRNRESIAPWLYGVACRVARRAQIRSTRRRKQEVAADIEPPARDSSDLESSGTDQALQEEIRRLPDSLRTPLISCCLEGQSYELAARRLGVRESTLRGRLYRARRRLERQLRRRGILSPVVAGLLQPSPLALSPLSSSLIESTAQLAVRWSTVSGLLVGATAVPESIAVLAQGAIHAMLIQTLKVGAIATILTMGVVGTLVVAQQVNSGAKGPPDRRIEGVITQPEQKAAVSPGAAQKAMEERRYFETERKRQQILRILDDEVKLDLSKDATLSQVLKAIKQATSDLRPPGLPIYVNRTGLEKDAGKALGFPVDCLDLRAGKVRDLLRQALGQLHLSYVVSDGFVMISSREEIIEERLDGLEKKFDRLLEAMERLERAKDGSASRNPRP